MKNQRLRLGLICTLVAGIAVAAPIADRWVPDRNETPMTFDVTALKNPRVLQGSTDTIVVTAVDMDTYADSWSSQTPLPTQLMASEKHYATRLVITSAATEHGFNLGGTAGGGAKSYNHSVTFKTPDWGDEEYERVYFDSYKAWDNQAGHADLVDSNVSITNDVRIYRPSPQGNGGAGN